MELTLVSKKNAMELMTPEKQPNRRFQKLRLSITEECNLKCNYCDRLTKNKKSPIEIHHLLDVVRQLHQSLQLNSIRITGGEPTLSPYLTDVVRQCKQMGIPEVNMTTNGVLLGNLVNGLKLAGLSRVNISLDAIDREVYKQVTGADAADKVLDSIEKTLEAKIPVKINTVIMKGFNENQILPILDYGLKKNIPVRFLELMKMGHIYNHHDEYFFSSAKILSLISEKYRWAEQGRNENSTSAQYHIGNYSFGIIANHSQPFCEDCDRLRLDHKANLYGCLSSINSYNMSEVRKEDYNSILNKALCDKMDKRFMGSQVNMRKIGG